MGLFFIKHKKRSPKISDLKLRKNKKCVEQKKGDNKTSDK